MRERHRAYVRELSLVQWTRHGGERVAGHVAVSLKEGRISYELGQTLDAQEPRVRIHAFQVLMIRSSNLCGPQLGFAPAKNWVGRIGWVRPGG